MVNCHCGKRASFNISGESKGRFCAEHKEPNMVNVKDKTCEFDGCTTIPIYNIFGETTGRFCAAHKEPNMIDVKNKTCGFNGCDKQPAYNISGESKGRFCAAHKEPNMIDVKAKKCEFDGCTKQPAYNISGESKRRFCAEHKEPNMVNVKAKMCEFTGCTKQPAYNISGDSKGRFCAEHKEPNMVNVKAKMCEFDGCTKIPIYNISGETTARFCVTHKEPNMVNVKAKTCEFTGCNKIPSYNISDESKGRFCAEHKEPNMVDVTHKSCDYNDCYSRSSYGLLGKGISRCSTHKQKGMITTPNRKCETPCCHLLGTHEYDGIRYCEDHKPDNAENLGIEKCISCGLDDILTNGKCSTCDPQTIQTIRHAKENRVKDVLTAASIKTVHDKMLEGTYCGRERPDFQIDCGTHFVYVEVDEHQHNSYACECEQTRMVNLVNIRGMPVRWIRYNPDSYEPLKGQRSVKKEQREKKLVEYVKWAMNHSPQEEENFSDVLYLFYNEYDTKEQIWEPLIKNYKEDE
jgi:hypothetical protein